MEVAKRYCQQCGKEIVRKIFPSGPESGQFKTRRFCGPACRQLFDKDHPRGFSYRSNHKRSAKHRQDHCQICHSQESLHVHHIDGNHVNNSIDNLQTVCSSCHSKIHSPNFQNGEKKKCHYCLKESDRFGLCTAHYTKYYRNGSPLKAKKRHGEPYEIASMWYLPIFLIWERMEKMGAWE